jgi:hypothetical protein
MDLSTFLWALTTVSYLTRIKSPDAVSHEAEWRPISQSCFEEPAGRFKHIPDPELISVSRVKTSAEAANTAPWNPCRRGAPFSI